MKASRVVCAGVMICFALASMPGCASLSPRSTGTRTETLRTWKESRPSKKRGPLCLDVRVMHPGIVVATLSQSVTCLEKIVALKETQEVEGRSPPWFGVGLLLGGSAAGVGLGGYLAGSAPNRPSLDSEYSRDEFSREGALGLGISLLTAGLVAGGMALWSISKAKDLHRRPQVTEVVISETPSDCGREGMVGAKLVLSIWDGHRVEGMTDEKGSYTFSLNQAKFSLPPAGRKWAKVVAVAGKRGNLGLGQQSDVQPQWVMPPPSAFVAGVLASNSVKQYELFKEHFPGSDDWEFLKTEYQKLLVERDTELAEARVKRDAELAEARVKQEAEQAEAREARRAELRRDQATWKKETKARLARAKRLARKKRWGKIREVLEDIESPPFEEDQTIALTAQIEKLRTRASNALEPDYRGIKLGMTKAEVGKLRRLLCDRPKFRGQRCVLWPKERHEVKHKAIFIKGKLAYLEVNFRERWEDDFDKIVAPYKEALGPPTLSDTLKMPAGMGSKLRGYPFLRMSRWTTTGYTLIVSCHGRKTTGQCRAFEIMMMDQKNAKTVEAVMIKYVE